MIFKIDDRCADCYGDGKQRDWTKTGRGHVTEERCMKCFGTGHTLTEIGRELMTILAEHYDLHPRPWH